MKDDPNNNKGTKDSSSKIALHINALLPSLEEGVFRIIPNNSKTKTDTVKSPVIRGEKLA